MNFKDENKKNMISVKRNITKGEIGIYVIALMLVAAGYLNYTAKDTQETLAESTYSETSEWMEETKVSEENAIGDATLVSNNEIESDSNMESNLNSNTDSNLSSENNAVASSISQDENEKNNTINKNNITSNTTTNSISSVNEEKSDTKDNTNSKINESIQTSSSDTSNYFVSSKLERDTMYSQMISTYEQIVQNPNVTETQKSIASEEISKINSTKNAIMICENLLNVKGFSNCVVFVNKDSVNVVLDSKDLSKDQIAQIQNVISREMGSSIDNIHIMSK